MPPVREVSPEETPVALERVEVSPGNFIKMSPADKEAHYARIAEAEEARASWEVVTAGGAPAPTDEAPASDVVPLTILSKDELKELAEKRGLSTSGSKDAIAKRFVAGDEAPEPDPDPEPTA